MKQIILVLFTFAVFFTFQIAHADCIAPDGTACTYPSGLENLPMAPPVVPPDVKDSPRPPGYESDLIVQPVHSPSIENNSRPPFEINYVKRERFDVPYFNVLGHGDHLEEIFDNNYSLYNALHRANNNCYTTRPD